MVYLLQQVEENGEAGDTSVKRRRKEIGDIWGSMVSQSEGPMEGFRDREPFSRHAAITTRRGDYGNNKRRDWSKPPEENGRERGRDRNPSPMMISVSSQTGNDLEERSNVDSKDSGCQSNCGSNNTKYAQI